MTEPKALTPGGVAFLAFLEGENPTGERVTLRAASLALGVSDPTILDWKRGETRPSPILRIAIERWTNGRVLASAWEDEAEQRARERAESTEPLIAGEEQGNPVPAITKRGRRAAAE